MQRSTALRQPRLDGEARASTETIDTDEPVTQAQAETPAIALIGRWLDLSEVERRAFIALARELTYSSDLVESSTLALSERFQALAEIAHTQMQQMDRIIAVAKSIEVNGESVPLEPALHAVEEVLRKVVDTILSVSKHAMRMVYALEDVARDVVSAEQCVSQIESINTQTRYLALNAAIEAARSAEAGAAFRVIATEIKDLSLATEETSRQVRERIASVASGVRSGHRVLQEIATLDMSEHIMAKERLDSLINGIMGQNTAFTALLAETADSSADMARTVSQMITGIQFQDRTKQHIAEVVTVLGVLQEGTVSAQQATWAAFPGRFEVGAIDEGWLNRIVEKQALGAVKQRILARLLNDGDETAADSVAGSVPDEPTSDGDVELF